MDEQLKQGFEYNREKSRKFIQELNFLGYKKNFPIYEQDELNKIARECFLDHYK